MQNAAYDEAHYARAFPDGYARHFWHRARLHVVLSELARLDASVVLDIGCGPGQYVRALRDAGYECYGSDPGDVRVDAALSPYVFPRADADAIPPAILQRVQVGLLLDVVEHLPDPAELLTRVGRAFPRLAAVVVTAPARQELWSELDRHAGHRRRYRLEELSALIVASGFVVTEARYLFRLLYPVARLTTRRGRRRRISAPAWSWPHELAGRLLAAEAMVLPRSLPGTSVLCVARPSGATP
jgi:SAM-dependent methyltransferase